MLAAQPATDEVTSVQQVEPPEHVAKGIDVLRPKRFDGTAECSFVVGKPADGFGGFPKVVQPVVGPVVWHLSPLVRCCVQ